MPELDHEIRQGLERLSQSTTPNQSVTFEQISTRRRQRRVRTVALLALPVVVLGVFGITSLSSNEETIVAAEHVNVSPPPDETLPVTVERTQVIGRGSGTAEVVMDFDGPLPSDNISYIDDITAADPADGVVYTTQEAASVTVCDSVHSFPPPADGTVDLLIPADWFADGVESFTSPLDAVSNPAKFVVCGPHNGFYQYSIWGPVSADADEVSIEVAPDLTRITVRLGQPATQTATGPASRDDVCEPFDVDADPLIGLPDIQAHTSPDHEAWALFFVAEPQSSRGPFSIARDVEMKIVWQATGEGDVGFVAVGPDGSEVSPTSGPSVHGGSTWERVPGGDEWGTGWSFPQAGCWRFELSRDNIVIATLDVTVDA